MSLPQMVRVPWGETKLALSHALSGRVSESHPLDWVKQYGWIAHVPRNNVPNFVGLAEDLAKYDAKLARFKAVLVDAA